MSIDEFSCSFYSLVRSILWMCSSYKWTRRLDWSALRHVPRHVNQNSSTPTNAQICHRQTFAILFIDTRTRTHTEHMNSWQPHLICTRKNAFGACSTLHLVDFRLCGAISHVERVPHKFFLPLFTVVHAFSVIHSFFRCLRDRPPSLHARVCVSLWICGMKPVGVFLLLLSSPTSDLFGRS